MTAKKQQDILEFIAFVVGEFAQKYNLTDYESYEYLNRYEAIAFLIDCYEAEHTLSLENVVEDVQEFCVKKGGNIS